MKTSWIKLVTAIMTAALLLGCYETKLDYVVNPDGSGKVTVEVRSSSVMDMNQSAAAGSSLAKEVLKNASGIDTWKDIEFKKTDDGKNYFKGIAYFPDINKARFKNISMMDSLVFYKDAQNNLILEINSENKSEAKSEKKSDIPKEDLEKTINEQKAQFQQMRPMLSAFLGTMKTEMTFQLPGKLEKSTNFKKDKNGNVSLKFEGEKFIGVLDKLMADEAWWRQQALAGSDIKKNPPSGLEINEQLFGEKGPVKAQFKGKFKDLFDYNQEMTAAKAGYDAMIASLGLSFAEETTFKTPEKVENYTGGNFTDVRIVRTTLSNMTDPDYNMFGNDQSYRLSVMATLPGAVLGAEKAVFTSAIADNGDQLLQADEWNRETTYIQLSMNKNAMLWDMSLLLPDRSVRGIRELSGFVYASTSSNSTRKETGLKDFKEGSRGTEVDVVVESVRSNGTSEELNLKFNMPCNLIKDVEFYDASGRKLEVQRYSSSDYGEGCSLSYYLEGAFPAKGSVKVEIYENVTKLEIPFRITDVDLFGNPLK